LPGLPADLTHGNDRRYLFAAIWIETLFASGFREGNSSAQYAPPNWLKSNQMQSQYE